MSSLTKESGKDTKEESAGLMINRLLSSLAPNANK
jgi:hypothetical protein